MSLNILIADDDDVVKSILNAMLGSLGHKVRAVSSGAECLEFFEKESVDILFLDYLMDDMSGGDVISAMKAKNIDEVKIVVTTGNSREELKELDPDTEIQFYLAKPFDLDALKSVLEELSS